MYDRVMAWSFLTNHTRTLRFVADRPEARLVDIAGELGVNQRTAGSAAVPVKKRDGRRSRNHFQHHLPIPEDLERQRTIGEFLDVLIGSPSEPPR